MKKTNIFYWIFTSLFAALMFSSAIPDVLSSPVAVQGMHNGLGYPVYFVPFIGVAKVLGVIAILVPGYPKLREWAYAGLIFDLLGATYSLAAIGQANPSANPSFMALPLVLGFGSYYFYHRRRKLQSARTGEKNVALLVTSAAA